MANNPLPILYVVQIGEPDFQRFVIEDEQDRVWTGERFDSDGGALFAKHNDAATEAQNILRANFKGVEPERFVVPLYVEVLNHAGPVPVAEIGWPVNTATPIERETGLAEPDYTDFVPPSDWRYQCPVCGSRVEKQIDVCWRCGYGRDGDSTAYHQRWGNG
jgi:hypothetical protein